MMSTKTVHNLMIVCELLPALPSQVAELEKEMKLKQLKLKEVQRELETEKALSSKLYDDVSQ